MPPGNHLEELHGDRQGQLAFGLMTNGDFVSYGASVMLTMSRSSIITKEL